jgi:hypothetical protein
VGELQSEWEGKLADAGILARRSVECGTTGYTATDVFSLVTHAEQPLASTRFSAPNRAGRLHHRTETDGDERLRRTSQNDRSAAAHVIR